MADARKLERLPSGVPGLDELLAGGFFRHALYVIEGSPGAGKTILANQVCLTHARRGEKAVYFTLLTEAHDRMLGFMRRLRFFDESLVPNEVRYVSGFKTLEAEGLPGVSRAIREVMSSVRATLLVIDGVVSAAETAESNTQYKKFLNELQTLSSMFCCTVLLLTNGDAATRSAAEHTLVDGVIQLAAPIVRLKPQRTIEVAKFRGGAQLRGTHSFQISDDGITVWPRIEILLKERAGHDRPTPSARAAFGAPGLDRMTGGGLPRAANTMLLGPSGAGKTVVALRFLAGGLEAGETCLYFGFYEQPVDILRASDRLGLGLRPHYDAGRLLVEWHSAVEASVDGVGHRLLQVFETRRPDRVVIDGMHGFMSTADSPERIQDFFAALADFIQARGMAMAFTAETDDLLGQSAVRVPFSNASVMAQATLLVRLVEVGSAVQHSLCVLKIRDRGFDPAIRRLVIGERGADVGEVLDGADCLLSGLARRTGPSGR